MGVGKSGCRGSDLDAKVAPGQGLILGEGGYGGVLKFEGREAGDEGIVSGRFGKMLERVEDSSDAAFSDVGLDVRPSAEAGNAKV